MQGLLELAGVPYVGAGVLASALCMDKDVFKSVLRDHDIPVTENITLRLGDEPRNPFGYPCFVKPARLGSSVGITKAHDDDELQAGVALAFEHDEKVLVERFVEGTEIEVGVLGNREPVASLPGEIVVTHNEWYDFEAKYDEGEMDLIVPARISEAQIERAQELAVRAFIATDCEGMARADLFVRADGEVLVNELNTIPGFTVDERLRAAVRRVRRALRRAARPARRRSRSSASIAAGSCAIDDPQALLEPVAADRRPPSRPRRTPTGPRSTSCSRGRRRAASSTTTCRSRSGGSCTTRSQRGFLVHGSNEPAIDEFRTRANLDAHQQPIEAVFASDDAIWPLYFAVVNRPVAQSYINWCEHVGDAVALHLLDRLRPARRALLDDRDDLPAAARDVPRDAVEPRARQRGAGPAARAADRRARRLPAPAPHPRAPARRVGPQRLAAERAQVAVTSLIRASTIARARAA